ncbi:carbon-nitrogen hydrolase family protein [Rhodotorula paludigena]|uniref:carbon-nitrogen hydrolase family protein n=1 Tax=Rhodotorula paludigena TaxID=86838 RepID=UPI003171AF90
MAPVTVAAVQIASVAYDLEQSLVKLEEYCRQAAATGARLAVFPEAYLSAYPRHLDFRIGARTEENRAWYRRYVESSVKIPDGVEGVDWLATDAAGAVKADSEFDAFKRILRAAKENKLNISLGIIERSLLGATLWCTNLLISDRGILLGKHRKLTPTAAERVVWSGSSATNPSAYLDSGVASTDNLPVVSTSVGRVGGVICWEHFVPLQRYALYRKGVEIWTAPTADSRPTWAPAMQFIAQEGRMFVISANQYHKATDFPSDYPPRLARAAAGEPEDEVWSRGGSVIVNPLGEILAGPLWDSEGILTAEIDTDDIFGFKLDMDCAGSAHYSREHDVFRFEVRT